MRNLVVLFVTVLLSVSPLAAQNVMTPELLWRLQRVSEPVLSPDGGRLVVGVRVYDIAANSGNTDLFIMRSDGSSQRRLTDFAGSEFGAQWRPDGRVIGFLSARGGSTQLWEIAPDGSGLRQVTDIEGGIANFRYAPTGTHVSFTRDVKLDQTVNEVYPDLPKADARVIDDLMFRHWDSWHDFAYSHLFVAEYRDGTIGTPVDLMPGERYDTPLNPFGGVEQINWSADATRIAYTAKKLTGAAYAVSTNSDIYVYDLASGTTTNLTDGMMGYDIEPVYSPDGRYLAWLSMERDGYEADRNRLFLLDLRDGTRRELTSGLDADAHGPAWSADSRTIYFTSEIEATVQLFAADVQRNAIRQMTRGDHNYVAFDVRGTGGNVVLIAGRQSMSAPTELFRVDPRSGTAQPVTTFNASLLSQIQLARVERRIVKATDGADIHTWVIYPPGFDPSKHYPAILYAQGGPQSAVSQFFSYRWNFQAMAANGYIVVAPNRRGVPSFGQAFKEEISGDWGGQAMQDMLSAIDAVAAEPYVDANHLGAVGASFGGYTVYWLAGNHHGRFKTFISHDGAFNLESMYGATEEMFFVNQDLGGPYWASPEPKSYREFSPHRFVQNWDTPILVIHGEQDFRLPVTEGIQAFTAARIKGIEARFLYFPEEGHWVLTPQNGILWHRIFNDWLARYLKGPGT